MLRFKLHEIPHGKSEQSVALKGGAEKLGISELIDGSVDLLFDRAQYLLQVQLRIQADVQRVCDRSLESYVQSVQTEHLVIFKSELEEESEDEATSLRKLVEHGNSIDLTEMVRDSILLALPIKSIHPKFVNEDGSLVDFGTKTFGPDSEEALASEEAPVDQRWAKLQQLKQNN